MEEKKGKKNIEKKINAKKGKLFFKLLLCPLTFGSHFCPSVSNVFSWHLLFFEQKKI